MAVSIEDIAAKLDQIQASIDKPDLSDELWTIDHIARYMNAAYKYTRDYIVKVQGFPKPRKITTDRGTMKRWNASEVRAWVDRRV